MKRQWAFVKGKEAPWEQVPDQTAVRQVAFNFVREPGRTRADEMREMAKQGASRREIAERFGVCRQAVYKIFSKNI